MDLDFFNNLGKTLKQNKDVKNFIDNLGDFLQQNNNTSNEEGILKQLQNERKTSIATRNSIRDEIQNILKEYANNNFKDEEMYFISSKKDGLYISFKYENGEKSIEKLAPKELPEDVKVNDILKKENENYVIDNKSTEEVIGQIEEMENELLNKQDKELENFRKDGHIYKVEEQREDRIYLIDVTSGDDLVLEEVDFPQYLLNDAVEETTFKYENGNYLKVVEN